MRALGKRQALLNLLIGGTALLALAACAVGPDFRTPDAPNPANYTVEPLPTMTASADLAGGDAQRFLSGRDRKSTRLNSSH